MFVQEYAKEDEETGEVRTGHRTIIFGDDGKSYVTASNYLYNTLKQIFQIFGMPTEWDSPLTVEVIKQSLKNGKSSLSLKLVEE